MRIVVFFIPMGGPQAHAELLPNRVTSELPSLGNTLRTFRMDDLAQGRTLGDF